VDVTKDVIFRLNLLLNNVQQVVASSATPVGAKISVTQRRTMSNQDVHALRNLLPDLLERIIIIFFFAMKINKNRLHHDRAFHGEG